MVCSTLDAYYAPLPPLPPLPLPLLPLLQAFNSRLQEIACEDVLYHHEAGDGKDQGR